jgi:DNA-binding CsgD family transcriptional regulator
MISEIALIRNAGKVTSYIEKHIKLASAEKREEVLELFETTQQFFPQWAIATCPVMHPEIQYASKNCLAVLGHSAEQLLQNSKAEKYFTYVHDADQQDLYQCFRFLHDYLESVPPDEHTFLRAVMHYRFRKSNGQYIYLHDEKAALYVKGSGNLYYALLRDATSEKAFTGVRAELFRQQEGGLSKIMEYKPSAERNPLSKREGEIVTLIKQGLSTKEIGSYLNISHNTVRNIKSKLFEKFNVNNIIELLNMTG